MTEMQARRGLATASGMPAAVAAEMPALRRYAYVLASGDRDRADDLVQECLLRALTRSHRFRPGTNLRAWLITILRNLHIDEQRRQQRQAAALALAARTTVSAAPPAQDIHVELRELDARIAGMPARDREILRVMGIDGCSTEEAARQLRLPPGTVKSRLSRARQRLPSGGLMTV